VGAEMKLTKHVSLRLEAKVALYPRKSVGRFVASDEYTYIRMQPKIYSATLGLVYTF
jgi:hypothetical protein